MKRSSGVLGKCFGRNKSCRYVQPHGGSYESEGVTKEHVTLVALFLSSHIFRNTIAPNRGC